MWQAVRWSQAKLIRRALFRKVCQVAVLSRPRSVLTSAGRSVAGRPRRLGMIATAAELVFTVSACSQTPGAGVVVGDVQVPETTIQTDAGQVIDEYSDPSASLGTAGQLDITRAVATNAVRHELVQAAAKANGITVDEAEVNQTLQSIGENKAGVASELKIPQAQVDDFVRDLAVLQALLKKAPEGGTEVDNPSVVVDYVTAANRDEAVTQRAKFLNDPAAMDAAIAAAPTDPSTGSSTAIRGAGASLVKNPGLAASGIFLAEKGDILLIPSSGEQVLVVRVTEATSERQKITSASLPTDSPSAAVDVLSLLLVPYAEQEGVTVNPRYGQWDPRSLQVVPNDFGV